MNKEKKYRTLIVDDEKFARADLKVMLSAFPTIEIIGEAKNISTAVEAIKQLKPDLIFLDIQFPGETGFELFERIDVFSKVIFVTAYDEYAIRAFDVNACDYLIKPVNPKRLALAINRLQENIKESFNPNVVLTNHDSIYLQINYKYYFVKLNSIIKISSADHFTEITTTKGLKGLTTKHLCEWESSLPKQTFIKIHRTTIININYVEKIEKNSNYALYVKMKDISQPIPISRRYAPIIKKDMSL
ncbi:MAG: LytTR family DNA-binding domain-containing protein [bacterium]